MPKCLICQKNESGSEEVEICLECLHKLELYFCVKCLNCYGYAYIPLPRLMEFVIALDRNKIQFDHMFTDDNKHIFLVDRCADCSAKAGTC
jgi:hypothetical protein